MAGRTIKTFKRKTTIPRKKITQAVSEVVEKFKKKSKTRLRKKWMERTSLQIMFLSSISFQN